MNKIIKKEHQEIERIDIYLYTYCEINKADFVSATMSVFEINTNVIKNSYTDSSSYIPNANPVIANCYGRFPKMFIEKPYRVVICDSHGTHVFEDNYE